MEKITIKGRYPTGLTTLEIEDDEKTVTKQFRGFRTGLSWPMASNPGGFFCVVGQETRMLITGEFPLMVIKEFEAPSFTTLIEKMFDEMGIFGSTDLFADCSPRFQSFLQDLDSIRRNKRPSQRIIVKPAPYASSFIHGNELIKRWIREIKGLTFLKNGAIRSQLREIREQDLKGEADQKFFAINALRYVLGAFETSNVEAIKAGESEKDLPSGAWT